MCWYSNRLKGLFLLVIHLQVSVMLPCQSAPFLRRRVAPVSWLRNSTSCLDLNEGPLSKHTSRSAWVLRVATRLLRPPPLHVLPRKNRSNSDLLLLPRPRMQRGRGLQRYRVWPRSWHVEESSRTWKRRMIPHRAWYMTVSPTATMWSLQVWCLLVFF